jgi:hypothetical protein
LTFDYSASSSPLSCCIFWWQSQQRNCAIRAGFGSNGKELIPFPHCPHFQLPRYIFRSTVLFSMIEFVSFFGL